MPLKIHTLLIVLTLTAVLGARAEPDSSENTQLAEESSRDECRELYESCSYPSKPCCENRPCKCSIFFNDCLCYERLSDIFGILK
uniref:Cystine knot toxin n=1 Tax=Dolomedes mizhoanus TaxID=1366394 RepID=S5MYH0_9ARAC|nr:cystine knot toxin [Dolomedes mizhoanus]